MQHPYHGIKIVLPTKHNKGGAIRTGFRNILKVEIEEFEFDTDQLGTFSGEVERKDTPKNTALRKLEIGAQLSGAKYAIASEGSIGNDPVIPFAVSDIEILVFKDFERDLVILETLRSFEIKAGRVELLPGHNYEDFLIQADFPNHSVIAKTEDINATAPIKGINNKTELDAAIKSLFKVAPKVILESDFRANQSPSRMANIEKLASKLATRLANLCRNCSTPGFGEISYETGVICTECKRLNPDAIRAETRSCIKCDETEAGKVINNELTPDKCIWCNP